MEMKKFEEYLKEAEGKLSKIVLFKLIPTEIKQFYKIERTYEQVVDYQKTIDVLNGKVEDFYMLINNSYSTKDMVDIISGINDDDHTISYDIKEDISSMTIDCNETSKVILNKTKIDIVYDDKGNISEVYDNNGVVNKKYYYEYDEHNRLTRFYNDNPIWFFTTLREVDKPWEIIYEDENKTSYNHRTKEYTKYDDNMNKIFSVILNDDNVTASVLKKYIYSNDGVINIIDIRISNENVNKFKL